MTWRVWFAVVVVGLAVVAPAAGEQAPAPLMHAETQTAHASSMRMSMRLSIRAAGQSVAFTASGFERPKAHEASMVVDMTQLSPTIGKMKMLSIGSSYYIHYDMLDTLRITHPQVKPWIVADSASAVGFDPWSFSNSFSSVSSSGHYQLLGKSGTTTRYRASITLRSAVAANPQLKPLMEQAGSVAPELLDKPIPIELEVGDDGYLHRALERMTMTIAGQSLAMTIDIHLSDFNADTAPINAPSADQVMTLAQFKKLANG
jgi:hypothetical protein